MVLKLHKSGGGGDHSIQNVFNRLEKDELNEKIRLLSDECQFYMTKIKELENRNWDQGNRIEMFTKHESDYMNQIHELQEENKKLEIEVDDQKTII